MSDRQLPVSPFSDFEDEQLPDEQRVAKRLVQDITQAVVMPFEAEKSQVTVDHVRAQTQVWGPRPDHGRPIELSTDGRKA